ncbi:protease modulator HflC [Candidatus Legionella polyplacis]|uniref:Protein HflC n=1 Tax=Candidatus Legionella polyplacis TaxID=2005262 RepID=A0ABZ2GW23_9GAMM
MKIIKTFFSVILLLLIIMFLLFGFFVIKEGSNGILLRLGRLVLDNNKKRVRIYHPGLHIKIPFIDNVYVFDTRLKTLDIKSSRIVTKEKKDVIVGYYVKWKIIDLGRYFIYTGGDELKTNSLLSQQLNTSIRAEFGKHVISEVVSEERDDINEILRKKAKKQADDFGIEIIDVRIKGIEFPNNTSNAIYQLMRANMKKIANRHRADGNSIAEEILASADARVIVLLAKAKSEAQIIRSHGKNRAFKIYLQAFKKNLDFFSLYQYYKTYKNIFYSSRDLFILDGKSKFFKYFVDPSLYIKNFNKN